MSSPDQINDRFAALSGQRVLITGARGFLGSHLRNRLVDLGARVHGVSRSGSPDQAGDEVRWWQGDFADIDSARRLVSTVEPEVIFHLSGLVTANPDRDLILPTMHSLLVSTVNALVVADEAGCRRLVLAGSLNEPRADTDDPVPSSPYAAAKWAGGAYARMFHYLYETPVVIARTFMTYGPMQDTRKLVPYVIVSLLRNRRPELSSGDWQADWIYVDDVIDGLLAAAQARGVEGRSLDLGSGTLISNLSIVEEIVTLLDTEIVPAFGALPDRPPAPVRPADLDQTRSALGWRPRIGLSEGLRRTIEWYEAGTA